MGVPVARGLSCSAWATTRACCRTPPFAKEASGRAGGTGWTYLTTFATHYVVWLPLLALLVAAYGPLVRRAGRRERLVVVTWTTAALLTVVYVVRVGGDYVPARLLLPGVFGVCAPVAFMRVKGVATRFRHPRRLGGSRVGQSSFPRPRADPRPRGHPRERRHCGAMLFGPDGPAPSCPPKSNPALLRPRAVPGEPGPEVRPDGGALRRRRARIPTRARVDVFDLPGSPIP